MSNVFLCTGAQVRMPMVDGLAMMWVELTGKPMTLSEWRSRVFYDNRGQVDWPGGCRCRYCCEHPESSYFKVPINRQSQIEGIQP